MNILNDWVEIFKGGQQTDSNGITHNADRLIDQAVKTFEPSYHEPPVVLGHPKDNAPAWAWVSELKTETVNGVKTLFAKFKDVVPEFADILHQNLYKKRSASFYKDGRLRHVGFLGAMPPAVKGLKDIGFSASEDTIDFEDENKTKGNFAMDIKDFFEGLKFWRESIPKDDVGSQPIHQGDPGAGNDKKFSEADLEAAKQAASENAKKTAEEEIRKSVAAEFAEKAAKAEKDARLAGISKWIEDQTTAGKLAPAWVDAGLKNFMENLADAGSLEFTDKEGNKQEQHPLEWFQSFIDGLPKLINFNEIARRDNDARANSGSPDQRLMQLVEAKMKTDKDLVFSDAVAEVQREFPEIAQEYLKSNRA
jgi:hypothetical protein